MNEKRAPDAKSEDGTIAVWANTTPTGKPVYNIAEGPKNGPKVYTEVWPDVAGKVISPKDVIEIYKGNSIEMDLVGQTSGKPYVGFITSGGIENRPRKDNSEKTDRVMRLELVLPLTKKEGGELYGFQVGSGKDAVKVFAKGGAKDGEQVMLEPRDAVRLVKDRETLQIGPYDVKLKAVEETVGDNGKVQRLAKIAYYKTNGQSQGADEGVPLQQEAPRRRVAAGV